MLPRIIKPESYKRRTEPRAGTRSVMPWQRHNALLISAYQSSDVVKHRQFGDQLERCGAPKLYRKKTGEWKEGKHSCKQRTCARCQFSRQKREVRKAKPWFQQLILTTDYQFIYLTVGFKHVAVDEVTNTVNKIGRGLEKIRRHNQWPGAGDCTSKEFQITSHDTIYPHLHILIAVRPSYFQRSKYLTQREFRELVRKCFGLSAAPTVFICTVQGKTRHQILKNVLRVYGYGQKPQEYWSNPPVGILLGDQLRDTRRCSLSGIFKTAKANFERQTAGVSLEMEDTGCSQVIE